MNLEEIQRIAAEATPWEEIERLAREAEGDPAAEEELAERIVSERPYMSLPDAYTTISLAQGPEAMPL